MTTELLIGFAKPMLQKFSDKSLKDQSIVVEQLLNLFADWFSDLKNEIPLLEDEDDLLIMLQLQEAKPETATTAATERGLYLIPTIINKDDKFTRLFIDDLGINLTILSQSIPVPKLILLILTMVSSKSDEHTDVFSELTSIITEAVNLPECKLHTSSAPVEEEVVEEDVEQTEAADSETFSETEPSKDEEEPKVIPLVTYSEEEE